MKYWIISLALLLIGSNLFWFFSIVDDAVSCAYSDASFDLLNQMYEQSLVLSNLNLVGLPVNEAKVLIGRDIHGFEPYIKEGCLYVGQICLEIGKDQTIEVVRAPSA
jgi:hypothetical protein|tara:strand:- start:140 stop:460 length:321 start_codon:yes stop_codon:yes gene_type:complete